jgi:hypothetical protein
MPKPLRYTGDWPPPNVLSQYSNWVFAYDEEGEDDQDETTVRPEEQQSFISHETQLLESFPCASPPPCLVHPASLPGDSRSVQMARL